MFAHLAYLSGGVGGGLELTERDLRFSWLRLSCGLVHSYRHFRASCRLCPHCFCYIVYVHIHVGTEGPADHVVARAKIH
jgi:hypothetical protein